MAENIKQQLIDAWRSEEDLTPGVVNFLTAEIPEPPDITTPADVDAAIIANGVAAKYILDLFRPFAGLTPVEMVLHIGQLNTVLQGAYMAGLEYLQASNAQHAFAIVEPAAGGVFQPGNLRLIAKAKDGNLTQVAVEVSDHAPIALSSDDGAAFYGFARLEEEGDYTLTFHALFDDDAADTATVSVTISTEAVPDPDNPDDEIEPKMPDGEDLTALTTAKRVFDDTMQKAVESVGAAFFDECKQDVISAADKVVQVGQAILSSAVMQDTLDRFRAAVDVAKTELGITSRRARGETDPAIVLDQALLLKLGDLSSAVNGYQSAVVAEYYKNNQHPAGGYVSCPEVLQGAAQAMNDKYGPGSVSW